MSCDLEVANENMHYWVKNTATAVLGSLTYDKATSQGNRRFYRSCSVTRPMNTSEAGNDLALIPTSVLFSFKCQLVSIRAT